MTISNTNKKLLLTTICASLISLNAQAQEIQLNLQTPEVSESTIEIKLNKNKLNSDLIKLITLEGMTSTQTIEETTSNKNNFAKYFLSGDDKFAQSNITAAYNDYNKAVAASNDNDFQALLVAYKLANIGFFTLSQLAINQIDDIELYKSQTDSIKQIFYPEITLSYDEEILLAEMYADIYYNNLSKETTRELARHSNLLKKSDYANFIMAQAHYEAGEFHKALNSINKALNIKKNSPFYLQYKAKVLCETKDYSQSLKILDKIKENGYSIKKFTNNIEVQKNFTLSYSTNDIAKSKYYLAKYFFSIGEYNRALKEVTTSISAKKKNYEAYALSGLIQTKLGDYSRAKEALNKAITYNKKYAPAYETLGYIEKLTGTYENALSYYNQALKYDKHNLNLSLEIAKLLNLVGNETRAKEICADLILKYPTSSELFYTLSEIYPQNQYEYLRQSLSLNAFNNDAWIDFAELSLYQNGIEQAEKYLKAVKVTDKENYKYYYVEGLINKQLDDISAASVSFKKSLKLNPNYTPAQKELNTLNL